LALSGAFAGSSAAAGEGRGLFTDVGGFNCTRKGIGARRVGTGDYRIVFCGFSGTIVALGQTTANDFIGINRCPPRTALSGSVA
jgi:hypothetical protein